jgi:DNA-binding NtrC family response regulator
MSTGIRHRVLYVDDDPSLLSAAVRILTLLGHDAQGLREPRAALAAIEAEPDRFDLVITDLCMPIMNGIELAQAIQRVRPGLPLVLVSGGFTGQGSDDAGSAGVLHVLPKPYSLDALSDVVTRSVAGASTP